MIRKGREGRKRLILIEDDHPQFLFPWFVSGLFGSGHTLALDCGIFYGCLEFRVVDDACVGDGTIGHDVHFHAHLALFVHCVAYGGHHTSAAGTVADAAVRIAIVTGTVACARADAGPLAATASTAAFAAFEDGGLIHFRSGNHMVVNPFVI